MVVRRRRKRISKDKLKTFHLHLVSDATGTTLLGLARACTAQFEGIDPVQKFWPLIRTQRQLDRVLRKIEKYPGPIIFTMVDKTLRQRLQDRCEELGLPCIPILDPIIRSFSSYLGLQAKGVPGLQHAMDDNYFKRVEAVDFAMRFDDGRDMDGLREADVVLVGVSRTSKTPTSIFLARRGIKCANIPLVPGVEMDASKFELKKPLYVGLTTSPKRLIHIRRNRLNADQEGNHLIEANEYLDEEKIEEEVRNARKLFNKYHWPVIDVTKRSIEETAAEILALIQNRAEKAEQKTKKKTHD